jgi:hypothetical protein
MVWHRTSWSRRNALHLYSGGVRFESQPGNHLSWLRFSWFSSVPSGKCRDRMSSRLCPFPSKSFPILSPVRHDIFLTLKSSLNKTTIRYDIFVTVEGSRRDGGRQWEGDVSRWASVCCGLTLCSISTGSPEGVHEQRGGPVPSRTWDGWRRDNHHRLSLPSPGSTPTSGAPPHVSAFCL